jgi:serine/threonine-protein kinase
VTTQTRRTVGQIEIERDLGRGGMGVVRLGRQPGLDRPVVLKTLRRSLASEPALAERFLREARTAASVQHQNVVAVFDCLAWRGEHVIVQEYVDGVDLSTVLDEAERITPRIAGLIALEVLRGLEEIHALGIVHRDLKPSNLLLSRRGAVKIADFGIALGNQGPGLTQTGHAVGTPPYMSPEQLLGETADVRSDLFSLGVLFYEMLTGCVPFKSDEEGGKALVRQIQSGRYPKLRSQVSGVPAGIARLIDRSLAARPRKRPQTATDLREGLETVLGAVPPGECRAEISAWLWGAGVFHIEDGATVALPQQPAVGKRRRRPLPSGWLAAAAAALGLVAGAASLNTLAYRETDLAAAVGRVVDTLRPAEVPVSDAG